MKLMCQLVPLLCVRTKVKNEKSDIVFGLNHFLPDLYFSIFFILLHFQHPPLLTAVCTHMCVYKFAHIDLFTSLAQFAALIPAHFSTGKAVTMDTCCVVTFRGRPIMC